MKSKPTVSLEDLLKVKRAERPADAFWAEFEREMRVKQLAAIVEPRPWWAPLIRIGAGISRYQLPVGAAAILVLSLVTIREYRVPAENPQAMAGRTSAPSAVESHTSVADVGSALRVESLALATEQLETSAPISAEANALALGQSYEEALPEEAAMQVEPSPSSLYIAANLAAVQADNPALVEDAFGSVMRTAVRRDPVRDPLTHVSAPGDARRSRLLATALPVVATTAEVSSGGTDRVVRRLTEERLYDSISRFGVQGDRVAIRF